MTTKWTVLNETSLNIAIYDKKLNMYVESHVSMCWYIDLLFNYTRINNESDNQFTFLFDGTYVINIL